LLTSAIPERLRDEQLITKCYTYELTLQPTLSKADNDGKK